MSDAELLHRIQQGDTAAWKVLYARCLPGVWRYAFVIVRDITAAEDIVSETMLSLVQNLMKLDPDACTLHAWLRSVVRHKVGDYRRRLLKEQRIMTVVGAGSSLARQTADPSGPMELEEHRHQIWEILDRLQKVERLALEWKYLDRLSVREIAARLAQTEKSVESILFRARREFRRWYDLYEQRTQAPISRTIGEQFSEPTSESSQ